ncbi:cellobiose phosphorylase [Mycobacteroides abscessus subsp. abscessus]|nr:cellobiose phosphorylase [Mycobacteroides abscessus subsp. abscessus]
MLLAHHGRQQNRRRRRQRIHSREDALGEHRTGKLGGGVQVRECGRGCRVGVVVGGHVHGLHRGDGAATCRGDALLQFTHLIGQRRLVTHGRRHTAQQGRHLGAGLGEPEDVVDEQQHVLALLVTEVLRHRQCRQGDPHTRAGRLVHLAEHQGGVLEHVGVGKLDPQVVAFTGALTHAGEDRGSTEVAGDAVDHLLDQNGLAHTGTTEQRDLATTHVRGQQVDDLQTGLQHLGTRLELIEGRRLAVDRPLLEVAAVARLVQAVAQGIEHVALDSVTDGHRNGVAGADDVHATDQAVGGLHRDGAHQVVTQVLCHLEGQRLGHCLVGDLGVEGGEERRHGVTRELHVDDRAGNADHSPGGLVSSWCGHYSSLLVL